MAYFTDRTARPGRWSVFRSVAAPRTRSSAAGARAAGPARLLRRADPQVLLERLRPGRRADRPSVRGAAITGPTADVSAVCPRGEPIARPAGRWPARGCGPRLRAAVRKAIAKASAATSSGVRVQRDGSPARCACPSSRCQAAGGRERACCWSVFRMSRLPPAASAQAPTGGAGRTPSASSEIELKATREELQRTIEELEGGNEELQASNEEVMLDQRGAAVHQRGAGDLEGGAAVAQRGADHGQHASCGRRSTSWKPPTTT